MKLGDPCIYYTAERQKNGYYRLVNGPFGDKRAAKNSAKQANAFRDRENRTKIRVVVLALAPVGEV